MKRITTILMLLMLVCMGTWAYSGIKLTFSRTDAGSGTATNAVSDVTVNVTDTYGNALPGITATLASTSITELKTGSAAALGRTTNSVLAPNAGYDNAQNSTIEYVFCVTGLDTDYKYKYAALDVYALTGGGASQNNSGVTQREWTFDISTGTAADDVASFISQSGNDICTVTDESGGLYHKNWEMTAASEKTATSTLYIKVVLTKTASAGCFAGLAGVTLSSGQDTWESRNEFTPASGGYGAFQWYGVKTPGDATTTHSFNAIQLMQRTGADNGDNYLAIAYAPATSTLDASQVIAISNDHHAATSDEALVTYNFTEDVKLLGGSVYYFVFLTSNTPTDGAYTVGKSRLSLNHTNYGAYPYGNSAGNTGANYWLYYKAVTDLSATTGYCVGDKLGGTMASGNWKNTWTSGTSPSFTITASALNINNQSNSYTGGLDIQSGTLKSSTYTITAPTGKFITGYKLFGRALTTNQTVTPSEGGSAVTFTTNGNSLCVSGIETPRTTFTLTDSNNSGLFLEALQVDLEDIPSVTALSGLSNSKKYNIINNGGWWAVGASATDVNSTVELNLATSTSDTKQQFAFIYYDDDTDDSNDGYYLYSVSESKFVYKNGSKLSLTSLSAMATAPSKVTFTASTNDTYKSWAPVIVTVDGTQFGVSTGYSPDIFGYNNTGDGGNATAIYETGTFDATDALAALEEYFHPTHTITFVVKDDEDNEIWSSDAIDAPVGTNITEFPAEYLRNYFYTYGDITPVTITGESATNTDIEIVATHKDNVLQYTATTSSPIYYNLNIRSKYLVYDDDATGDVTLQDESEPFNPYASWAFIGSPYAGFKIINKQKGTGHFLTYTSVVTGSNHSNNNVQFVAAGDFTDQYWLIDANNSGIVLRMKENTDIYFHHDNSENCLRTCSKGEYPSVHNDVGSTVVSSTDEDVLFALNDYMLSIKIGSGAGECYSTDPSTLTDQQATATIASVNAAVTAHTAAQYPAAYAALVQVKSLLAVNAPATGFYRLKNVATDKYLVATATSTFSSTNKYVFANGTDTDVATVIRLFDKDSNGTLYMYNQGYGFGWTTTASVGGGVAWITDSPDKYVHWFPGTGTNQIAFAICYGNGEGDYASHLKKGIYTANGSEEVVAGADDTVDEAQWVLEEATTATVTLKSDGAGTYYATGNWPFDVTVSGADAYTLALDGTGTWLVPTQLTNNKVPANTPVMLKGSNASATLTINTGSAFSTNNTNSLSGTNLAKDFTVTAGATAEYFMGISGGVVGFYHSAVATDGIYTLGANKAYLGNANASRGFAIKWNDDEVTGIRTIDNGKQSVKNGAFYDLSGRRVENPQHGMYIVNGRVVVIK